MKLSESKKNYLKTIYELEQKFKVARVKDIAEKLNITMPSVTNSIKALKEQGLVVNEKNSYITLTKEGYKIADSLFANFRELEFFCVKELSLSSEEATDTALKLSNVLDTKVIEKITKLHK